MRNKLTIFSVIAALVATLIITVSVVAQQLPRGGQGQPSQPPQEAITACQGKTKGKVCQIKTSQGTVSGTCQQINNKLVCTPAGQPSPGQPSPGQPSPGQPSPGQPSPGQPSPRQPSPGQPSPRQPSPGQPSPGQSPQR